MRELTLAQSGIDQIVAEDVSGDYQGRQVSGAGRQQADPIDAQFVELAEAIELRRRIYRGDAGIDPPCSLTVHRRQLEELSIGQKIRSGIAGAPAAECVIDVAACGEQWCGTHPGRRLAGSRFLAVTDLADQENPAVRRRPVQAGRVRCLLSERTIRAARPLDADLVVKSVRTIDLDVDPRRCPGIKIEAELDGN